MSKILEVGKSYRLNTGVEVTIVARIDDEVNKQLKHMVCFQYVAVITKTEMGGAPDDYYTGRFSEWGCDSSSNPKCLASFIDWAEYEQRTDPKKPIKDELAKLEAQQREIAARIASVRFKL